MVAVRTVAERTWPATISLSIRPVSRNGCHRAPRVPRSPDTFALSEAQGETSAERPVAL